MDCRCRVRSRIFPVAVLLLLVLCEAKTRDEWVQSHRVIYQLLTDRFTLERGKEQDTCGSDKCEGGGYCGGTWTGLTEHLDYIKGMGFNAIWISPHVQNTKCGFHGFWPKNFDEVNDHFGTEADLHALIKRAHGLDLWIVMDTVLNHMSMEEPLENLWPFNDTIYYHKDCPMDYNDQYAVRNCWLMGLPDLDDDIPQVRKYLIDWAEYQVHKFGFDGYRMDAIAHMQPETLYELWERLSNTTLTIGETFMASAQSIASYQFNRLQQRQLMDGVTNYPLAIQLRLAFGEKKTLYGVQWMWEQLIKEVSDLSALALFIDSHDLQRFLNLQPDVTLFTNALTWILGADGIPIVYYGSEQAATFDIREPLWRKGYDQEAFHYKMIRRMLTHRKAGVFDGPQQERYVEDWLYIYSRNNTLVVTSNLGSGHGRQPFIPKENLPTAYTTGTILCNVLTDACDTMVQEGGLKIVIGEGKPLVLVMEGDFIPDSPANDIGWLPTTTGDYPALQKANADSAADLNKYCFEYADYLGNDVRGVTATSPDECQSECQHENMCEYFSFIFVPSLHRNCWLKNSKEGRVQMWGGESASISGPKTCPADSVVGVRASIEEREQSAERGYTAALRGQ
ncbi:unnamed protein product [Vitrella brassicaformis CCMP3155]|uniref:Apple domain-containing protein n=1 Tax=Vitrella brassicaformis (strain CCMP3155) TaxID=1169540 RepID=A0A0G4FEA5_VITBC|nr:unnamed protein product [Vitrella brassicaformis CCMP3155]|eukprot:CEM11535.1 unnamed protein product [Vitrella brassicaformis CCMP3155]